LSGFWSHKKPRDKSLPKNSQTKPDLARQPNNITTGENILELPAALPPNIKMDV
jgi:hypothetical protein